ncbi:MAG: helix-turn-helix domain-containing protein [Suipraeoptans sp.]
MQPFYEKREKNIEIFEKRVRHNPPHIHESLECVYITQGSLALGIEDKLFPMEEGDFAIVFPELIHHYQVFDSDGCAAIFLIAHPSLCGSYIEEMNGFYPREPVIKKSEVHPDVVYAIHSLIKSVNAENEEYGKNDRSREHSELYQGFLQVILARTVPRYHLIDKENLSEGDLIYKVVSYMARNYKNKVSLTSMAENLGYSPYALSRVFSGTFHTNFNRYLNRLRLGFAFNLLIHTQLSITDVWLDAGFESQRTFQRVFKQEYGVSPRDYRRTKMVSTEYQR